MRLHFVLASAAATAVMSLACGHSSSDNDGMLRQFKPLGGNDVQPAKKHVSRSRLPMTNNAQSMNAHAEPTDPWESQSTRSSSQSAITASRSAPEPDNAALIANALDESSDEAVAAALEAHDAKTMAAGRRRDEPASYDELPDETDYENDTAEATDWPEPASNDDAYDNSYVEASYDDDSYNEGYDESEPDDDDVEAPPTAIADVAQARLTVRVRGQNVRCKVSVCGRKLGRAPFRDKFVEAGRHLVSVRCPKNRTFEELVEFEAGRRSALFLEAGDFNGKKQKRKRRHRGRGRRR